MENSEKKEVNNVTPSAKPSEVKDKVELEEIQKDLEKVNSSWGAFYDEKYKDLETTAEIIKDAREEYDERRYGTSKGD